MHHIYHSAPILMLVVLILWLHANICCAFQWAPEDTSTPIKAESRKEASRTLDDANRSFAAAGTLNN